MGCRLSGHPRSGKTAGAHNLYLTGYEPRLIGTRVARKWTPELEERKGASATAGRSGVKQRNISDSKREESRRQERG